LNQSNVSNYTEISFAFSGNYDAIGGNVSLGANPDVGGQVDFQVQALIGYLDRIPNPNHDSPMFNLLSPDYNFTGETGDWSNTQTITIPASSTSASDVSATSTLTATPTSTLAAPELSWLAIVPLLLSVFSVAVIVRHRKAKHE
jgi:hypothetical protein